MKLKIYTQFNKGYIWFYGIFSLTFFIFAATAKEIKGIILFAIFGVFFAFFAFRIYKKRKTNTFDEDIIECEKYEVMK